MITPSIFDTKEIIELKSILKEMDERRAELDPSSNAEGLAKIEEIKEEEKKENEATSLFGKPMANAGAFKDITCNLKVGIKRSQPEPTEPKKEEKAEESVEPESKRAKISPSSAQKSDTTNVA